ncbi:MAG: hypothetical protein ACPGTO_00310 [Polaribacter sp.]
MVRELERKLPQGIYSNELELYKKVLAQEKNSKHKIYSLYEPEVYCMSKGKAIVHSAFDMVLLESGE